MHNLFVIDLPDSKITTFMVFRNKGLHLESNFKIIKNNFDAQ